jgi:isopenicillin N synthase-like dioxygenase
MDPRPPDAFVTPAAPPSGVAAAFLCTVLSVLPVPSIDIAPYVRCEEYSDSDRASVAASWDAACRAVGFVQIHGHGVRPEVIDGLGQAMDAFFLLDPAEKKRYIRPPAENRGYTAPRSESLSLSLGLESAGQANDFFEAFNIGSEHTSFSSIDLPAADYALNTWPEIDGFRPGVEAYWTAAGRVARTLTTVCADALGLPTDFFAHFTSHSLDTMRMNNYALPGGLGLTPPEDVIGMGAHSDYGIVTVLWADPVPGLQILGTDRAWHDVQPEPGALLVNLGDLLARWTNDRWLSTLHRVKPPIIDGTVRRRRSTAFFHDGNVDAVIETIATCRDAEGGSRYGRITVGEHVRAKLAGSRAGVINRAGPETERVLSSEGYSS